MRHRVGFGLAIVPQGPPIRTDGQNRKNKCREREKLAKMFAIVPTEYLK